MPLLRSALDTRHASWPITAPKGVTVTGDTAQVAFVKNRWDTPSTWFNAEIVVDATRYGDSTPRFRILLGPANSGISPGVGTWYVLGKITDSPEVPVECLDVLTLR